MTSINQISDSKPTSKFLFVGNGPYRNRGCEAIVRGTMEILTEIFVEIQASAGVMASPATVAAQQQAEIDSRITNFSVSHVGPRFSLKWCMAQANKRLHTEFQHHTFDLRGRVSGFGAAMQLGGDNYSLDYGRPLDYMAIDRFLLKKGIPVYIWGASVGPFEQDEEFAPIIHQHLKTLNGIFVRETATQKYLAKHGVTENVYLVADPAFVMRPMEPTDLDVKALVASQPIGINISPLVARFSSADGLDAWRDRAVEMIVACAKRIDKPILLIPHVASPQHDEDDYAFMASLQQKVSQQVSNQIGLVPPLGAAELKWLIARCCVFAGARTHATIAALSSGVPTLSLSYSVKAIGINQDVFGHQEFCHSVKSISPEQFALAVDKLVAGKDGIRALIESRLPAMIDRAKNAGRVLHGLMTE